MELLSFTAGIILLLLALLAGVIGIDHDAKWGTGRYLLLLKRDGTPYSEQENPDQHKVGPWKCPYHNSRACLEMIHRINFDG